MTPLALAAATAGISTQRLRTLCRQGRVANAIRLGRDWFLSSPDLQINPGRRGPRLTFAHQAAAPAAKPPSPPRKRLPRTPPAAEPTSPPAIPELSRPDFLFLFPPQLQPKLLYALRDYDLVAYRTPDGVLTARSLDGDLPETAVATCKRGPQ